MNMLLYIDKSACFSKVCVCVCACARVCMCMCLCVRARVCVSLSLCVCVSVCVCLSFSVCLCVRVCVSHTLCVCMCVSHSLCVCVCVCMCAGCRGEQTGDQGLAVSVWVSVCVERLSCCKVGPERLIHTIHNKSLTWQIINFSLV